jgi:archaemetzincin
LSRDILISPMGDFPPAILDAVARMVRDVFRMETRVQPILEGIDFAWDPDRGQYHSTPILQRLATEAPPEAVKVAALCRVDLFIPILTYVFGEAQLDGRACIVSSYRLADSGTEPETRFISRMAKEVVHELGHTFNLRHCRDPVCLMHYCRSESDVDHKSDQFCRYCKVLLGDALQKL